MLKQKLTDIKSDSVKSAVWYIFLIEFVKFAIYFPAEYVFTGGLMFLFGFMIIFPIWAFVCQFKYAKRHGQRWYMLVFAVLITVIEYFTVKDFKSISPNIIAVSFIAALFGSGFGSSFADEGLIAAEKEERKKKKLHEDKKYKNILDD